MKAVIISFLIFITSLLLMLPAFHIGVDIIPAEFAKLAPFVLMGLAMLCQWNALADYKQTLELNKALACKLETDSKQSSELTHKDHKIAEQEKTLQTLQTENKELRNAFEQERSRLKAQAIDWENKVQSAQKALAETERALQVSLESKNQDKQQSSGSEVLTFLSLLQEKGRFLDFLMDDITLYSDNQVGAAGRVVHQGCSKVLGELFRISPLHKDDEGTKITLRKEDSVLAYRVLGKTFEHTPFDARILHRGWGTDTLKIPRRQSGPSKVDEKFVISPVEVEAYS